MGVEVGYGGTQLQIKSYEVERNTTIKSGGVYYGLVAGYKHFFTPYLGFALVCEF